MTPPPTPTSCLPLLPSRNAVACANVAAFPLTASSPVLTSRLSYAAAAAGRKRLAFVHATPTRGAVPPAGKVAQCGTDAPASATLVRPVITYFDLSVLCGDARLHQSILHWGDSSLPFFGLFWGFVCVTFMYCQSSTWKPSPTDHAVNCG